MIDTHCHLTDERLGDRLEEVIASAAAKGVSRLVTIGTGLADSEACVALCRGRENLRCTVGIHPNYSPEITVEDVERLRPLVDRRVVMALGEAGLDYHHAFADRRHQAEVFRAQLRLAQAMELPVVVHCREAIDDALEIMRGFRGLMAVFHCFTGSPEEAQRILSDGHWIGFTGAVTFKKNEMLREAARLVPDERLLIETEAPYLTPEPMRKVKINEPAFVVHVAEALAAARGASVESIDLLTTANAQRFFNWA